MNISPILTKIVILGLVLRILLAIFAFGFIETSSMLSADSRNFYQTAQNLVAGNGFTKDLTPPYNPEAHFPPVYPLLIAGSIKTTGFIVPLIALQIILASLIPLLVWMIAGFLTESRKVKIFASLFSAIEPLSVVFSVMVLTEVVSVFFALLSILLFLKFIYEHKNPYIILSGISLGVSVLTRPHGQFLFILGSTLLVLLALTKKELLKKTLIGLVLFAVFFIATLSPWLLRNHARFGTFSISTTGLRNVYTSIVPAIISLRDNMDFDTAQGVAYKNLETKYGYTVRDVLERPELGNTLVKEGLEQIKNNKKVTAQIFGIALNAFFTQDLYYSYGVRFHLIPHFVTGFSPSVVLLKEGPIALYYKIKDSVGLYGLIPLSGRFFWIFINIFMVIGFALGVSKKETRFMTIFLGVIILSYAGTSSIAAFSDHGRFRFPATGFMYTLAGLGFWIVIEKIKRKFISI